MGWLGLKSVTLQRAKDERFGAKQLARRAAALHTLAQTNGWRYRDVANELVGRWYPTVNGLDDYLWVVEGTSRGFPIIVTTRRTYEVTSIGIADEPRPNRDLLGIIAVALPGRPPREFLRSAWKTEQAVRALGGSVPEPYSLEFRTDGWLLATRSGFHDPRRLPQIVELLTGQLTMVPPGFWQP